MRRPRPALLALLALALLAPGPARPASADPPANALVGEIPFEDTEDLGHVYLDLAPEGNRPMVFALDTGAPGTIVSPRTARAMGIRVKRGRDRPYQRRTRLGRDVHVWVDTRRTDTGAGGGFEYGVLGGDFLSHFVVEIDYDARLVRFLDPKRFRVPKQTESENEAIVPLSIVSNRTFAKIEIGDRTTQVLIDTGAPHALLLGGKAARKLGIDPEPLPEVAGATFIVGTTELKLFETEAIRLGPFRFGLVPAFIAPRGTYNLGGNTDSLLGNDLLRPFLVRFDYPSRRLWLRRRPQHEMTFFGVDYGATREVGLLLNRSKSGYSVLGVLPDSDAERFGLRARDQIVSRDQGGAPSLPHLVEAIRQLTEIPVRRRETTGWRAIKLPTGVVSNVSGPESNGE